MVCLLIWLNLYSTQTDLFRRYFCILLTIFQNILINKGSSAAQLSTASGCSWASNVPIPRPVLTVPRRDEGRIGVSQDLLLVKPVDCQTPY
jgi:hypothetical protein